LTIHFVAQSYLREGPSCSVDSCSSSPGALKRIAYNVAWMKVDPLWVVIIRAGLMPYATRIFERILRIGTQAGGCHLENDGKLVIHAKPQAAYQTCDGPVNLMGGKS
jgi:hypothetical protein